MSAEHLGIDRTVRAQQDANEQEFRRLRNLSLEERGWLLHAACQDQRISQRCRFQATANGAAGMGAKGTAPKPIHIT